MRTLIAVVFAGALAVSAAGCAGGSKQDIPLASGQSYKLEPSGKMKVFASDAAEGAQPLHRLRVKLKNEPPGAKTSGCWTCSDCICSGDDCACTECTACP